MLRIFKNAVWLIAVLFAMHQASAFTVWGPAETWQTADMDYILRNFYGTTELGGPKNFGEGSRLNVPIITYAYDYTFLSYFGVEGENAIDSAMAILNAVPPASSINLAKYNTEGVEQVNYTAQALGLVDLKSTALAVVLEHMGLLGETHTYDLRLHVKTPATCVYDYYVINRNYDPVTYNPSFYVNGTLYSYYIFDSCPAPVEFADAIEVLPDATKPPSAYTAVATKEAILLGGLYYNNLSRDDVGGLKYLYRRDNYNNEELDPEAVATNSSGSVWEYPNPTETNNVGSNIITGGIFGGVEKITFVKVHFNSFIGTNFTPIAYHYTIPMVTNGMLTNLQITRTVTAPDIIFSAADLVTPAISDPLYSRSAGFLTNGIASVGGGVSAGVLSPQWVCTFNIIGATDINIQPYYLTQGTAEIYPVFVWASYGASPAPPIIYPNGSSINSLEAQISTGSSSVQPVDIWDPFSFITATNTTTSGTSGATP